MRSDVIMKETMLVDHLSYMLVVVYIFSCFPYHRLYSIPQLLVILLPIIAILLAYFDIFLCRTILRVYVPRKVNHYGTGYLQMYITL